MYRYRKNKFNAKKNQYNGRIYHSKKEAAFAQELDWQLKAGEIKSWEPQVKIDLRINDKHIANYYIDFVVTHNDGTEEYIEVKGFETAVWKLKWKLFEAIHPYIKKTIVR